MYAFNPAKGLLIMLGAFIAFDYLVFGGSSTKSVLRAIGLTY